MTTPDSLKTKISQLYPEIAKHGIGIDVAEDKATDAWLVTMTHRKNQLSTHLEKQDADDCMAGVKCYTLGVQIGRFVEAYCLGQGECPV